MEYMEQRLGQRGVFTLYALRNRREEILAHRTQGAEAFRRIFTSLLQFNRPDAVKVVGYKSNQKRENAQVHFTETYWLLSPA